MQWARADSERNGLGSHSRRGPDTDTGSHWTKTIETSFLLLKRMTIETSKMNKWKQLTSQKSTRRPPFSPSLSRIKTLFKRDWSTLDETLLETCSCFREGRNRLWSLNRHFRCRWTTHWLVDDPNPMAQSNSSQMGCVDSDLYCAIPPDRIWAPINCSLVTSCRIIIMHRLQEFFLLNYQAILIKTVCYDAKLEYLNSYLCGTHTRKSQWTKTIEIFSNHTM